MSISAKSDAEPFKTSGRPSLISSQKPRRGRPPTLSDDQKRKRRNVSISDDAWEKLEKLADDLGYASRSELLERIGQGDVEASRQHGQTSSTSLSDILAYRRLLGLFSSHSDVLRSLVAFNYAIYKKLPSLESQPFDQLIVNNTLIAMSVVFQHCYIRPDRYVNSLSALIRLISYCLLLNQADLEDDWKSDTQENQATNIPVNNPNARECLDKIRYAMSHLKAASFSHQLTALRLKYLGGFTEAQIQQIYELQGMTFTIESIRRLVHEGWAAFRSHWSKTSDIAIPKVLVELPPEAEHYCNLLWSRSLESPKDRKALLKMILKATYDGPLNFWFCEIEYKWSTEVLGEDTSLDRELEQLQAEIQGSMDKRFQEHKQAIDKVMHYCLDRNEAVKKLADLFEQETQIGRDTQLGKFMLRLLQAEAEASFARHLTKKLKFSSLHA